MDTIAFIMAGGVGERFWPLSRARRPKQLLRLGSRDATLLEEAVARIEPLVGRDQIFVATGRLLATPVAEARCVPEGNVLAEPAKRNTLGCLCWVAANELARGREDAAHAVLTADHKIGDPEAFRTSVAAAVETARATGGLVTLGIRPTRPETGYGYIEVDHGTTLPTGAFRVAQFREKPNAEAAREYVDSGRFLWNSGMFFWTLRGFLAELERAQPEAFATTLRIAERLRAGDASGAESAFEDLPSISIDYALMERAEQVWVHEAGFAWDDLGAWDSLGRSLGSDEGGNTQVGDVLAVDCRNTTLLNEQKGQLLAAIGVEDLAIVCTADAILVVPNKDAQRVREIVERLRAERPELI
ncbi:MAG: sugar phosphate nucleotidyltransferase [Fimbriimonadaceae bacterium]|nr:sugar phosphate nucleotidyltransferase [Fimbriimonadaceae bacterium]